MNSSCLVIDDIRSFAFDAVYARTSTEGIEALEGNREWREVWFDHDLGEDDDIWAVIEYLEVEHHEGRGIEIGEAIVQSQNPVGAQRIEQALRRLYRVRRVDPAPFLAAPD